MTTRFSLQKRNAMLFVNAKYNDNDNEICLICHEKSNYLGNVIIWNNYDKACKCRLNIHQYCLNKWFSINKTCPICRNKLLKQDMKSECQKKFDNVLVFFIETAAIFCIGFLWLSFIKVCIDINFNKKIS